MDNRHPGTVPDYTTANLVLVFLNLLWVFGVIWSNWGLMPVIVLGVILNHLITRLEALRARRIAAARKRHGPNMPPAPGDLR